MSGDREQALVFGCGGESLVGVLSLPGASASTQDTGVVIVVGGPQYRAGSHRQFVQLARQVAAAGFPVLRFDVRGMGDSSGPARSFEALGDDVGAAIAQLVGRVPSVRKLVLWGLCDGASAALLYCQQSSDPRVSGLCLLNPWVRSEASLARTQVKHYYLQRLMQKGFWTKLLSGGVGAKALAGLFGNLRAASAGDAPQAASSYQQRMAMAWRDTRRQMLLLLSGNDYTAKEFLDHVAGDAAWNGALHHPRLQRHDLPQADHTFSARDDSAEVERLTLAWLRQAAAA